MTGTLACVRVYAYVSFSILKGKKVELTSNNATLCSVYKNLEGTALPENPEWLFLEQQALWRTVSGGWQLP